MDDNVAQLVLEAQTNSQKLNKLIEDFLPFIKHCVAKSRAGRQSRDDALTIAMLTFADCVKAYKPEKGSFLSFTQASIRNRLIDDFRAEKKFAFHSSRLFSDDAEAGDLETKLSTKEYRIQQQRLALKLEIEDLASILETWNTSFGKLSKICPKQKRTRAQCEYIATLLIKNEAWRNQLIGKHRMPSKEICYEYGVSAKILEKYRVYIATLCIIRLGDYPMLQAFLPFNRKIADSATSQNVNFAKKGDGYNE